MPTDECSDISPSEKQACEIKVAVKESVKSQGWSKFTNYDEYKADSYLNDYVNQVLARLTLNTEGMQCDTYNNFECRIRLQENLLIKPIGDQNVKLVLLNANKALGSAYQAEQFGFHVSPYDVDRLKEDKGADFEQELPIDVLPSVLAKLLDQLGKLSKQHLQNIKNEYKHIQSLKNAITKLQNPSETQLEM